MLATQSYPMGPSCEMAEVEESLKPLQSQKGVQGIIVVNIKGIPLKGTMDNSTTTQYANLMHNFILKAWSMMHKPTPRITSPSLEFTPRKMKSSNKGYFLIVIENPTE